MSFESSRERVLRHLRAQGKSKNSELLPFAEGDPTLLDRIREDLIFDDLAEDKNGVGLVYVGPADGLKVEKTPLRIFLSYGHDEHAAFARKLKIDLESRGHHIWFDEEQLKPGQDWASSIEQGLTWAAEAGSHGRVILVMTPHSVRRPDGYCLNEIAAACARRIEIVPIMLVDVEPPLSICRIQWLDMRECTPIDERIGPYMKLLPRVVEAVESGRLDVEGAQSRLFVLLNPLSFEADFEEHTKRFTGRDWLLKTFDAWLADPKGSRVFWLTGGPGIGKTAFSSKLCTERREVAAFHLCRHNHDQKADPRAVVRSIAWQLGSQLPDYFERLAHLPDLEDLTRESNAETLFDRLVVQPLHGGFKAPKRTMLVVIDGLDEATRAGKNELALFLSHNLAKLPGWMRLVLTSRPVPEVMQPLQELAPLVIDATAAENMADIRAFVRTQLAPYAQGGQIAEAVVARIAELSEGYFLYAEWIRKELESGNLSLARLDQFPRGPGGAYTRFFTMRFPDRRYWEHRVRPAIELITSAREPLTPAHLGEILGWNAYDKKEIPDALAGLFSVNGGTIRPFHRTVIDWVADKTRAGDYFVSTEEGTRRLAETGFTVWRKGGLDRMNAYDKAYLPRHLIDDGRLQDAVELLKDLAFLEQAWRLNEHDVKAWWAELGNKGQPGLGEAYATAVAAAPSLPGDQCLVLARLFYDTGNWSQSIVMYDAILPKLEGVPKRKAEVLWRRGRLEADRGNNQKAVDLIEQSEVLCRELRDTDNLQNAIRNRGHILRQWGQLEEAMALYREAERLSRESDNQHGVAAALGSQAGILATWGKLEEAMILHREQERTCRELGDMNGLQYSLGNQAWILAVWGRLEEAILLHKERERISRELGDLNSLQNTIDNQARILTTWGRLEEAMALHREQERICRELGNLNGLQIALSGQAAILGMWGKLEEAMALHKQEEEICRLLDNPNDLQIALAGQASIYKTWGRLEEAMALRKEEERICRALGNLNGVRIALSGQAAILKTWGRLEEAMALHKEEARLCRMMGNQDGLQSALGNQAWILKTWGRLEEAMALHEEEERICRQLGNRRGLQSALGKRACILATWGRLEEAMALHKEEERICRELRNQHGLQSSLGNQACILKAQGKLKEAMALHKEEEGICRGLGDKHGLQAALANQAAVLIDLGRHDEAMPYLEESIAACRKERYLDNLAPYLMNRALCLRQKGAYDTAREDLEEAARIASELNDKVQMATCYGFMASLHVELGEVAKAFERYAAQEAICRELNDTHLLCQCLGNQAHLLATERANHQDALDKAEEALGLAEKGGFGGFLDQLRELRDGIRACLKP